MEIRQKLSAWLRKQAIPVLIAIPVAICLLILAGALCTVGPAI